jgi:hypothetical protein
MSYRKRMRRNRYARQMGDRLVIERPRFAGTGVFERKYNADKTMHDVRSREDS